MAFRPSSASSVELPDRFPFPGTLRIGTDVRIVQLRGDEFALRGATDDAIRRQAAQNLLELGFEVQEETEPQNGPVAGRWMLLVGSRDGVQPQTPGRLMVQGAVQITAGCQGLFDIDAQKDVTLEPNTRWHGSIVALGSVELGDGAILEGNIDAKGSVRLSDGATVLGRIRCSRIVMSRAARVAGGVSAGRSSSAPMTDPDSAALGSNREPPPAVGPGRPASSMSRTLAPPPPRQSDQRTHEERETQERIDEKTLPKPAPWVAAPDPSEPDPPVIEFSLPPEPGSEEWTERAYVEATTSLPTEPANARQDPESLELVLGVDQHESRELLEALGIRRFDGRVSLELDLEPDRQGLILRRRESPSDEYWERRVPARGHPILESLREVLLRLGPETHAHAQVREKGTELHLGPVDPSRLPTAMRELSELVTNRRLSSVQAVTERRE